jgi:hypothetical protein
VAFGSIVLSMVRKGKNGRRKEGEEKSLKINQKVKDMKGKK